jgi:hypothetical protein
LDLERGPGLELILEFESSRDDLQNLTVSSDGSDSGEMLDKQAIQDYRRWLDELNDQLELARDLSDSERAAEIQSEIDFLARTFPSRKPAEPRPPSRIEGRTCAPNVTRAIKSMVLACVSQRRLMTSDLRNEARAN